MTESDEHEGGALDKVLDAVETAVTGVPAPIKKGAIKAFGRLFSAMVEIPAATLEGMVEERRAITAARVDAIRATGRGIADDIDPEGKYAIAAGHKYAEKIIGRQRNVDAVVTVAAEQLTSDEQQSAHGVSGEGKDGSGPSDDWLNYFEKEAELASSDDMRARLGKVLAGEIQRPNSFSVRAIQVLSQLDQRSAVLFQKLCSATMVLAMPIPIPDVNRVLDARVCSLGGSAAANSLIKFGLSFDNLNQLHEAGLIIADYNSYMGYESSVAKENKVSLPFEYAGKHWALVPKDDSTLQANVRIHGVKLSRVGMELRPIVDITENVKFTEAMRDFFDKKGFSIQEVKVDLFKWPQES